MFLTMPNFVTMIYTMCVICYALFALYSRGEKTYTSFLYIMICVAAGTWSFGYAVSYSAPSAELAAWFYLISKFGFMALSTLIFHFILIKIETEGKVRNIVIIVIYGLLFVSLISVSVAFNSLSQHFNMIPTYFGWAKASYDSPYDMFSYFYYSLLTLISLLLLMRWYRESDDQIQKRQLLLILFSFVISVAIGLIMRFIIVNRFSIQPVDLGPVLILIPASVALYQLEKNGLFNYYSKFKGTDIVNTNIKEVIFRYMATAFIIGGVFAFVMEYFLGGNDLLTALGFGIVIGLNGVGLQIVLGSKHPVYFKDTYVCFIVSLFVPFLMFFTLIKGSGTVWPAPILFIIAFMLYNNSRMIIGLSISIISTFTVIGLIVPISQVQIEMVDHFLRIFLTLLIFVFALVVNRFYIAKLKENKQQRLNQEMVNDVTSLLVRSENKDFKDTFNQVLKMIGQHFDVDRVYYFRKLSGSETFVFERNWVRDNDYIKDIVTSEINLNSIKWLKDQMISTGNIMVDNVFLLPESARDLKDILLDNKVKSTITVSIFNKNNIEGCLGMDSVRDFKEWEDSHLSILKILGNVLADASSRNQAESKVREMAYYDYLTGLPNRAYFFLNLERVMKLSKRQKNKVLIGLIDLDEFKHVNDTYGHDEGDALLIQVANRLNDNIRETDMISRFGGDEFLVYFSGVDTDEDAHRIGQSIVDKFVRSFTIGGQKKHITASLGLYLTNGDDIDITGLVSKADAAMYSAKQSGKNQYALELKS